MMRLTVNNLLIILSFVGLLVLIVNLSLRTNEEETESKKKIAILYYHRTVKNGKNFYSFYNYTMRSLQNATIFLTKRSFPFWLHLARRGVTLTRGMKNLVSRFTLGSSIT